MQSQAEIENMKTKSGQKLLNSIYTLLMWRFKPNDRHTIYRNLLQNRRREKKQKTIKQKTRHITITSVPEFF